MPTVVPVVNVLNAEPIEAPQLTVRREGAVKILSVSFTTLDYWTRKMLIPHKRIGATPNRKGVLLYEVDALKQWLKEQPTYGPSKA